MADMAFSSFEPDKHTDMARYITTGQKLAFSHEAHLLKCKLNDDTIIPMRGMLQKYNRVLKKYIMDYELSDKEYVRWRCQPKRLCLDVYGTPELWADILAINNMTSCTEFTKRKIKVYSSLIINVISELLMLYKDDLKNNRTECGLKK